MRAALFTKEFPPHIYGGAGVHVDYLSRELAKKIDVEVHCWGKQHADLGRLHVRGAEPWDEITHGTTGKFKGALEALSLNLTQVKALSTAQIDALGQTIVEHFGALDALFLSADRREKVVEVSKVRHVAPDGCNVSPDRCFRLVQLWLAPSRYEDVGAFFHESLGGR